MNSKTLPAIILASTSPRRISLLGEVRLPIRIESPDTDEAIKKGESPKNLVARLAREKAESVLKKIKNECKASIIIAADTIVVSPNQKTILGKPKNPKDAIKMIHSLSGKFHTVFTGYCLLKSGEGSRTRITVRVVKSLVKIKTLSPSTIRKYVATGEPLDKAGSYGAQGIGMAFIEEIRGSYTNVVGLPMAQVLADLEKISGTQLLEWIK